MKPVYIDLKEFQKNERILFVFVTNESTQFNNKVASILKVGLSYTKALLTYTSLVYLFSFSYNQLVKIVIYIEMAET